MAEDANGQGKLAELGNRIKAQREHLGLSIQEVQEQTKIRSKYLTAYRSRKRQDCSRKSIFSGLSQVLCRFPRPGRT